MKHITSRQNAVVTRYRDVARGAKDGDRRLLLLDGPRLVDEALAAGLTVRHALVSTNAMERPDIASIIRRLEAIGVELASASSAVMDAASPLQSPSDIVGITDRPPDSEGRLYASSRPLTIVACDIQNPGNLGAIVRVAEAAGATGVVAAGTCADPFGWKALRGSMGSALRLPIALASSVDQAAGDARRHRCRIVAAVPRDGRAMFHADLTTPLAILIGGEGSGLPQSLIDSVDDRITIPMEPPVESLNAAIAAALLLYEARRQRGA
jgi:TrmH family RNA methyltransferase